MSGGFLNLGNPVDRQRAVMTKALEARVAAWDRPGYYYKGAGDLLLRHGQFYSGRELPDAYKHLRGEMGQCFNNAVAACLADPTLRYCEGVYTTGHSHYTPHGWCLDPDGNLLEVTYPTDPATLAKARDAVTRRPIPSFEHWGYWGAVFHVEYVEACKQAEGGWGVLDRPVHDMLSALDPEGVRDERDDWPVLRYAYDPNRRTP